VRFNYLMARYWKWKR